MAIVLALLELLTVNAKIIELYLEGLTPEQKTANSTQVFNMLKDIHDGMDKVQGLIQHLHLGEGTIVVNPAAPPA